MTYCPKWGSRNEREPFGEQAGTLGDVHQAMQESGRPPYALHTTWGSRGLHEGGKVESALRLPQSPHGGRPAGKQAHLCSCSHAELFCMDPIFPVSCLGAGAAPSLGTARPRSPRPSRAAQVSRFLCPGFHILSSEAAVRGQDASREAALGLIKACQHSALLGLLPHSFFPAPRVHQGCARQWWVSRRGPEGACGRAYWETRGANR